MRLGQEEEGFGCGFGGCGFLGWGEVDHEEGGQDNPGGEEGVVGEHGGNVGVGGVRIKFDRFSKILFALSGGGAASLVASVA